MTGLVAHLTNDKWFLTLVHKGELVIKRRGRVYRKGKHIGYIERGYWRLSIWDREINKTRKMAVHRLVYITANGLIKDPYLVINHIDGVKTHNWPSNLEAVTPAENAAHAKLTGLCVNHPRGGDHFSSKVANSDIFDIRRKYAEGKKECTSTTLARYYNMSSECMCKILRNTTYRSVITGYEGRCLKVLRKRSGK